MTLPSISPIIPVIPEKIFSENAPQVAVNVLSALLIIGLSVLIAWTLSKVMKQSNIVSNPIVNMILAGTIGLAMFLRYGLTVTMLQGLFLFFVLLYVSGTESK